MPQTCSVCRHPQAHQVNLAVVQGTPLRRIAPQERAMKKGVMRP